MLTDFLYKYISSDKDCLLGLIPNKDKFAVLISPLNSNTLYPKETSIESDQWIKKYGILDGENVKISNNKSFISSDDRYNWSIKTGLNLIGNTISTGNNFTFSTKINVSNSNIGNRIVKLFKQGGDDVNNTLDIHFEFNRDSDPNGSLDKLVINVYYERPSDSVALNLQSFELTNIWTLVNTDVQLTIVVDSDNSVIKVYSNNNLIGTKTMNLSEILDLPLNTPQSRPGNLNTTIGGSKFLEMKNAYIWKRALKATEIQFLNKMNSERVEKEIEIPEDIDSLTFTAVENSSLKIISYGNPIVNGIQYRSSIKGSWKAYNIGDVINLKRNTKVQFRNTESNLSTSENDYVQFVMSGRIETSGNMQSMLNNSTECQNYCFYRLFKDCIDLVTAPNLSDPDLAESCYEEMFKECIDLIEAPTLPAFVLKDKCYKSMFEGCRSLSLIPELEVVELADYCFEGMFKDCSNIKSALNFKPSTELAYGCYKDMFYGCTNLIYVPESLPAEIVPGLAYASMFYDCSSLIKAPEIFLQDPSSDFRPLDNMFENCISLNEIKVHFNTDSWDHNGDFASPSDWVKNVSSTGTFYKPSILPEEFGSNKIPEGWTVENI